MTLPYDPTDLNFWQSIQSISGYPRGDMIPLGEMVIESGAIFRLPSILLSSGADPQNPLLVAMDPTPMKRGRETLKPLVVQVLREAGWQTHAISLEPDATGQVHTDLPHIHALRSQLSPGVAVLSIGSGVVTDVTKHACFLFEQETGYHLPFVIFQTANSVNAFTSNMAPTFIDGVKRTLPSRYADALVCDLETLRDAPREMTVAGVGDLLAAAVSFPDWYLAHQLGMDPGYSRLAQDLMGPFLQLLHDHADEIREGNLEGISLLTKLITLSGLTMSLSHATTPASGFEHVLSHILDLQNELASRPLAPHGSQVALAAMLGAETYRIFLDEFDPDVLDINNCYPSAPDMRGQIERLFGEIDPSGKAGRECWNDYAIKLEAWRDNRDSLADFLRNWGNFRSQLRSLAAPRQSLLEILKLVGGPVRFAQLNPAPAEEQVKFAFFGAPLMRRRLTIGDLLIFFGWDREKLWRRINRSDKEQPASSHLLH